MRKTLVALTAATLAVGGLALMAPAGAATTHQAGDPSSSSDSSSSTEPGASSQPSDQAVKRPHPIARRIAARSAAESIGVPIDELRAAVVGGQTVSEFAEAQGADPTAVQSDVVAGLNEAIDRAVTSGRVSEERAAKAREHVDEFAEKLMTSLPRKAQASTT